MCPAEGGEGEGGKIHKKRLKRWCEKRGKMHTNRN